jgi:hypothetical protein
MNKRRAFFWSVALGMMALSIFADAQSPAPTSGVEGAIRVSPVHGGPSRLGVEDSAPVANMAFDIVNDTGIVSSFTTDDAGHFRVALSPGHYSIKMHEQRKIGRCGSFAFEVSAGEFKNIHFECDSGMR